jgi:hypothetical protein
MQQTRRPGDKETSRQGDREPRRPAHRSNTGRVFLPVSLSPSLLVCLLGAVLFPGGCTKGPTPPRLVPVSGKVLYQNKPVPLAWLRFYPDGSKEGQGFVADGQSKEDGTFTLQTYPHGPGAVPGRYKVTIALEARGAGIPNRFADSEQTPLRVEVKDEGAPDLLLGLTD